MFLVCFFIIWTTAWCLDTQDAPEGPSTVRAQSLSSTRPSADHLDKLLLHAEQGENQQFLVSTSFDLTATHHSAILVPYGYAVVHVPLFNLSYAIPSKHLRMGQRTRHPTMVTPFQHHLMYNAEGNRVLTHFTQNLITEDVPNYIHTYITTKITDHMHSLIAHSAYKHIDTCAKTCKSLKILEPKHHHSKETLRDHLQKLYEIQKNIEDRIYTSSLRTVRHCQMLPPNEPPFALYSLPVNLVSNKWKEATHALDSLLRQVDDRIDRLEDLINNYDQRQKQDYTAFTHRLQKQMMYEERVSKALGQEKFSSILNIMAHIEELKTIEKWCEDSIAQNLDFEETLTLKQRTQHALSQATEIFNTTLEKSRLVLSGKDFSLQIQLHHTKALLANDKPVRIAEHLNHVLRTTPHSAEPSLEEQQNCIKIFQNILDRINNNSVLITPSPEEKQKAICCLQTILQSKTLSFSNVSVLFSGVPELTIGVYFMHPTQDNLFAAEPRCLMLSA